MIRQGGISKPKNVSSKKSIPVDWEGCWASHYSSQRSPFPLPFPLWQPFAQGSWRAHQCLPLRTSSPPSSSCPSSWRNRPDLPSCFTDCFHATCTTTGRSTPLQRDLVLLKSNWVVLNLRPVFSCLQDFLNSWHHQLSLSDYTWRCSVTSERAAPSTNSFQERIVNAARCARAVHNMLLMKWQLCQKISAKKKVLTKISQYC